MGQLAANEQKALGLLVAMDELDGLFASENAYRGGRGADEQILLETYDGNGQEILRVRDDVERRFDCCHVSIVGGIEPEVLAARVSEGDPRGKWARFCWAPIPRRVFPAPPVTGTADSRPRPMSWPPSTCRATGSPPRYTASTRRPGAIPRL